MPDNRNSEKEMKAAFGNKCSGPNFTKTTPEDCRGRLNFHSLLYLHQFSALTQAVPIITYSTSKSRLDTCPLFTVRQPLLLHQSQTTAAKTFNRPLSVCLPGRKPPQPAAPNIQRATGMFKPRAPTQSDLFTGRGRFKREIEKGTTATRNNLRVTLFIINLFCLPCQPQLYV